MSLGPEPAFVPRSGGRLAGLLLPLVVLASGPARAHQETETTHSIECTDPGENGERYDIVSYANEYGYRIHLPDGGSAAGSDVYDTYDEAAHAACRSGTSGAPGREGSMRSTGERPGGCGLGSYWDVVDTSGDWTGTWTRRGDSSAFDGHWVRPGEPDVFATLDMRVDGDRVTIQRTDAPNKFKVTDCLYQGTLGAGGTTASGTVTCNSGVGVLGPFEWRANIHCGGAPRPGERGGYEGGDHERGGHEGGDHGRGGYLGGAGTIGGQYLGCYADTNDRDLSGSQSESGANTPAQCVQTCQDKGFAYAGVQYGKQCFCGDTFGRYGTVDKCDAPCAGDKDQNCGGNWANAIYGTGGAGAPRPGGGDHHGDHHGEHRDDHRR